MLLGSAAVPPEIPSVAECVYFSDAESILSYAGRLRDIHRAGITLTRSGL